ncbi:MAG: ferredoxin [Pseudomonadota bacterium]
MPERNNRLPENILGKYYVASNCIYCETCLELAPEHFGTMNDQYAYVKRQPENEKEEEQCQEAMVSCQAYAIGDDGE